MRYVGSRHDEIAAMLYGPGEPQPQRLPGAQSLPARNLGRGRSEPPRTSARGASVEPEQPPARPCPNTYQRTG